MLSRASEVIIEKSPNASWSVLNPHARLAALAPISNPITLVDGRANSNAGLTVPMPTFPFLKIVTKSVEKCWNLNPAFAVVAKVELLFSLVLKIISPVVVPSNPIAIKKRPWVPAVCLPVIDGVVVPLTEPNCSVPVAAATSSELPVVWIVKLDFWLVVPMPTRPAVCKAPNEPVEVAEPLIVFPRKVCVSSALSPNIVEPLRDWYSILVTEELTI